MASVLLLASSGTRPPDSYIMKVDTSPAVVVPSYRNPGLVGRAGGGSAVEAGAVTSAPRSSAGYLSVGAWNGASQAMLDKRLDKRLIVRSIFDRWIEDRAGPEPGTPAAVIREHYKAAADTRNPSERWAEMDRIIETAKLEGFDEVPAAIERYRSAAAANAKTLEWAVKSLTRSIGSLHFRPAVGSRESNLLNAWAAFDAASRRGETEGARALAGELNEAALAADAHDVEAAIAEWLRGDYPTLNEALREISLTVFAAAYHRAPPRPYESY
jgi:hypothetical protein